MSAEHPRRDSQRSRTRTMAALVLAADSGDSEPEASSAEPSAAAREPSAAAREPSAAAREPSAAARELPPTSEAERSAPAESGTVVRMFAMLPPGGLDAMAAASPDSEDESEEDGEPGESAPPLPDSALPGPVMSSRMAAMRRPPRTGAQSEDESETGSDAEKMDESNVDPPLLHEDLAAWAKATKPTTEALNELLELLRGHGHKLPRDARTLLVEDLEAGTDSDFSDVDSTRPSQSLQPPKKRQRRTHDSSQRPVSHAQRGGPSRPALPDSYPIPDGEFQRMVLEMLEELKEQIQRINRSMGVLRSLSSSATTPIRKLETEGDFNTFEEEMNNEEERTVLVQQLARIGGASLRGCIFTVMDRMMSLTLMTKFNMMGGGPLGKKRFTSTALHGVIQDAVMSWSSGTRVCSNVTLYDIDLAISDHLKHSPARVRGGRN